MRFEDYAIYKGQEFEVEELDDGRFELYSRGEPFKRLGFLEASTPGVYTKIVKRKDIETAYGVDTNARYKGYDFSISLESHSKSGPVHKEGAIVLISSNSETAEKLGMEMTDRYVYEKWICIEEAEMIWEVRKPIYGFKLPEGMNPIEIIKKK